MNGKLFAAHLISFLIFIASSTAIFAVEYLLWSRYTTMDPADFCLWMVILLPATHGYSIVKWATRSDKISDKMKNRYDNRK